MSPPTISRGQDRRPARRATVQRGKARRRAGVLLAPLPLTILALGLLGQGTIVLALGGLAAAVSTIAVVAAALRVRELPALGIALALLALAVREQGRSGSADLRQVAEALGALHRGGADIAPEPETGDVPPATARRPFWDVLSAPERDVLQALAERAEFAARTVLIQEGRPADRILVIESGTVQVTVRGDGADREVALRGPGDLIGERAMLLVRERSATVTALTPVRALVAGAAEFNAFLDAHPRVVAVLERQFYARLTQDRPARPAPRGPDGEIRPVLFADVVSFGGTHRTDTDRLAVRLATYTALREAFARSGLSWDAAHSEDRGDGALVVLPADAPVRLVLDPLAAHLAAALRAHNRGAAEGVRIRLRLALDAGPITADPHGVSGAAIIHAARLLDAAEFKHRMASTGADVGLAVSRYVYESVVAHAPGHVDPAGYERIEVAEKETSAAAWIAFAGRPGPGTRGRCDGRPRRARGPHRPHPAHPPNADREAPRPHRG